MSKHTPGAWKVEPCDGNYEIHSSEEKCLADVWSYGINSDELQMLANANLMAAAPDLLEALEAMNAQLDRDGYMGTTYGPLRHAAIAAIARARGES